MPNIIETNSANCQDCYRCVRVCPISAIRVENGQARVDDELCVQCGTCVRECPQRAKSICGSLEQAKAFIRSGARVAASVAPAFAAAYGGWRAKRLPAALRLLGFDSVSETAEGAKAVADAVMQYNGDASITSCCPAVVAYIEKYRPQRVPQLMPFASPMAAHGRMLKARLGPDTKVVFIGPCAAKKAEAQRPDCADAIDAVLTFEELDLWLEEEGISLATCMDTDFETYGDVSDARLFALEGGLLKTADIHTDIIDSKVLRISGIHDVMELLDLPDSQWTFDLVEPLFCRGGCIGGPCMPHQCDRFSATQHMLDYAGSATSFPMPPPLPPMETAFHANPVAGILPPVSESRIQKILEDTGKADPARQLNCGACGYASCRDNAIAVARGLAEPGMCMAYVREKAESRSNRIIETSPNGIVVVDMELIIVHMNARFMQMFGCTMDMIGRHISALVDPDAYEKLAGGAEGTLESIGTRDGTKYQELIFALPGQSELTGIYVDVTHSTFDTRQVDLIKDQSLKHARDLLAHQIRFSQEMAHYLGKSTAQTEELVKRLMDMYAEGNEA